jgi:FAD/FMN-containing dehydrogenase
LLVCTNIGSKDVDLIGMEHLDSRYIKAVNYTTKATRSELPKHLDLTSDPMFFALLFSI